MVLVLVGVLAAAHGQPAQPLSAYGVVASSLLVLWLGVKLTYG